MEKTVLAGASNYNMKYFINDEFKELSKDILDEVKNICIVYAAKTKGIFLMGFYSDGSVYFETQRAEIDFDYDENGAGLAVQRLKNQNGELLKALQLWYLVYKTEEGKLLKEELLKS